MLNFALGFLCMWIISGTAVVLYDENAFGRAWLDNILVLPLVPLVPVFWIFRVLWRLVYYPWRYVLHPVSQEKFEKSLKFLEQGKLKRIGKRLWYCYDAHARHLYNRNFFVRVQKG